MKVRLTFNQALGITVESATKEVEVTGYDSFDDFIRRGTDDKYIYTGNGMYARYNVNAIELIEEDSDVDESHVRVSTASLQQALSKRDGVQTYNVPAYDRYSVSVGSNVHYGHGPAIITVNEY